MSKKSYNKCISDLDWQSAIENYESTSARWKSHWFECLKELYEVCKDFAKRYILDPIAETIEEVKEKIKKAKTSKYDEVIDKQNFNITEKDGEQCYLFEFYNDNDELLCSKVGTTTRTIRQRLIEELRSKTYRGMGATKAKINRVYNCGSLPAEGLESLIRSEYIKKYPKSFKKNDRFINEVFDFAECDRIANEYLAAVG